MIFTLPPQQSWLALPSSGLPEGLRSRAAHARIGRGGRLLFDRVHPLTYDPLNGFAHQESGVSFCNTRPQCAYRGPFPQGPHLHIACGASCKSEEETQGLTAL